MYKIILSLFLVALATLASATITITFPSANSWLVDETPQTVQWTYNSGDPSQFSMYLNNKNTSLVNYALANNILTTDKSRNISVTIAPSKGYYITCADIGNISNVYATSAEFEIKPNGSAPYSSQTSPSASSSSTNSSSPTDSSTPKAKSGANLIFDTQNIFFLMLCSFVTFMIFT